MAPLPARSQTRLPGVERACFRFLCVIAKVGEVGEDFCTLVDSEIKCVRKGKLS